MSRNRPRSIVPPIVMGTALVVILIALSVGWNIIVVSDYLHLKRLTGRPAYEPWLLVILGTVLFSLVIAGLILFIVFHARQIRDNQIQNNFIDAVSHEFRSPLTSLRLYLDTLRLRPVPPERTGEFYALMMDDVERLEILVERVLEAGRADQKDRPFKVERFSIQTRIEDVVTTLRRRYGLPAEAVRLELLQLEVECDSAAFDIVVQNVVENAIKYSRDGQVDIQVKAEETRPGGDVAIHVRDLGVGIPPRQLKRIFKRFYRVGDELTRSRKGTGLGLFIVKHLLRGMRGSISAASAGDNQGSTFSITLPGRRNG